PGRDAHKSRTDDEVNTSENPANPESATSDLNQPTDSPLGEAVAGALANITPESHEPTPGAPGPGSPDQRGVDVATGREPSLTDTDQDRLS
ncbi:MAG TPA: hypothetical protein VGP82_07390, partial [Ktedonobacterales bacterium]|nr:hypothetical protein [Ktedonobacterales bacterium]